MSDPDVSRAAVCVTANIMRNVPKTFFRSADGSHIASREASTEKQTAGAVNQKSPFVRAVRFLHAKQAQNRHRHERQQIQPLRRTLFYAADNR